MAANVETMMYVRERPWHGLGTEVSEAPNSEDALRFAGLDWSVRQENIFNARGGIIKGFKANVRDSDDSVLGVVGDRYIIRFIGDQISKARCKPNMESAEEYIPTGCCIVTGECTGGSRSSLLRCLVLPIERGDIDGNLLQLFQTQPQLLQTHLFHFLRWCGQNGSRIIQFIQREFLTERQRFISTVTERRLADTGAILMLVARIILQYALENRFLHEAHTADLQSRWEASLKVALSTSEACTHELDPLVMYLTAVFSMYRTGKLPLADSADTYSAERHLGFQDGNCWWLRPDDTFQAVKRYWKSAGQIFPLRDSDIRKQLYAHNLIEVTAEQRNGREKILYTKKSSTLPGRPRFLILRANDAADYLEHEQEYYSN